MPNYEFVCDNCKTSQEMMFSINEDIVPPNCDLCGGKTRRVYSTPGVVFNAPGFYKTGG